MTTATIDVFLLSCTQAKYELGILPVLRTHVRSHTPWKGIIAYTSFVIALGWPGQSDFKQEQDKRRKLMDLVYYITAKIIGY